MFRRSNEEKCEIEVSEGVGVCIILGFWVVSAGLDHLGSFRDPKRQLFGGVDDVPPFIDANGVIFDLTYRIQKV